MFRGEGIRNLRGYGRGDQYVRVVVRTPTNLTPRQEELLREFEASRNGTSRRKSREGLSVEFLAEAIVMISARSPSLLRSAP